MGTTDGGSDELPREASGGRDENLFVLVRMRPLNKEEIAKNDTSDWECVNDNTIIFRDGGLPMMERSMYLTAFTFDRVFKSDCSTRQVYEEGAKEVALSVVNGINSSIFAYGQTSSGKTYTMTGITEYSLRDIYDYILKHTEREFLLKFSAMEICNESIKDLLSEDNTPLRLLDDPERGTTVEKLTEEILRDLDHAMELLSICEAQRQIGLRETLNEVSSRSHQIIRLTIESSAHECLGKDNSIAGSVSFVDLAGSERASQSLSAGTRLKEDCHINHSLLTLGIVIRKLRYNKGRNGHIPFRDSKLTRILQSSLGGNARTAIICTMSPARSHVEQSRNTLLFASCAKEVSTNTQENAIMSEKALVNHLQRELARLEIELRNPGPTFATSDFAALLREKDRQIEKLEKEVVDLTLQRDVAQGQIQDLLRLVGDDGDSTIWVGQNQYPHLRVRKSPESEKTSTFADAQSLDGDIRTFDTSQYSDGQSGSCSEYHYTHLPEPEENCMNNDMSPPLLISTNSIRSDSRQGWEEVEGKKYGISEDICKEVRCIETDQELNATSDVESNHSFLEENAAISDLKVVGDEGREDQELKSPQVKEDKELSCVNPPFVVLSPEKPSSCKEIEDSFSSRSMSLSKSRSCKESLMISLASPGNWFEKAFIERPEGFPRKFSSLHYGAEVESLSRKVSQSSNRSVPIDEIEAQNSKTITYVKQVPESQAHEIESKDNTALKNVTDVSLDAIEDYSGSPSDWPSEFKRLQRDIIGLWNACNASLVHRTYFFMLFKGDPTDSIYMQVELRRLSFLKDTFSQGSKTVEDSRTLTPASSMKGLRRERQMLSKEMQKRLSEDDRECLYLKWGIGLNSKYRRLQLANRLWTDTEDMDHIAESAIVVAKLVGFIEPGQAPKEMFGLDFATRHGSRSYSLRSKVIR